MPNPFAIAVLASGNGSNLQAIIDRLHGRGRIEVVAVGSDKRDAAALGRAAGAAIATRVFERGGYRDRESRDAAIAGWLVDQGVELVVLAGYMQLLSPSFIRRFAGRIINVHPSLLPAFPGLDAVAQAQRHGVRISGVTVHFVDEGLDTGPIILQEPVRLAYAAESVESTQISEQIRAIEHRLLPQAIELIAAGAVSIDRDNPRLVRITEVDS